MIRCLGPALQHLNLAVRVVCRLMEQFKEV